jgi:hypothetical protein
LSRLSFVFAASVHSHAQYLCWVINHSDKGFAIFSLVVKWNWKLEEAKLPLTCDVTEAEEEIQIRLRFMRIYAIVCNVFVGTIQYCHILTPSFPIYLFFIFQLNNHFGRSGKMVLMEIMVALLATIAAM